MGQVWYKGNVAGQKYKENDVIDMLSNALDYVESDNSIMLVLEVEMYLSRNHSIPRPTLQAWIKTIYHDNISVMQLWRQIQDIIEVRVVKDQETLRPAIQGMVLQNKHNYRDRQDHNLGGQPDNPIAINTAKLTAEQVARAINDKLLLANKSKKS